MSADMYIHFFFLIHSGSHRLMLTKVLCKIFVRYAMALIVCMVVGFPTTGAIGAYHHKCCEFEPR